MTVHPSKLARNYEADLRMRDKSTQHLMRWLKPNRRLDSIALDVSTVVWNTANDLVTILEDGPELSAMLRKLREAKDCGVIQGLIDSHQEPVIT